MAQEHVTRQSLLAEILAENETPAIPGDHVTVHDLMDATGWGRWKARTYLEDKYKKGDYQRAKNERGEVCYFRIEREA